METVPQPAFEPTYLNIEYFFNVLARIIDSLLGRGPGITDTVGFFAPLLYVVINVALILGITLVIYLFIRIFDIERDRNQVIQERIKKVQQGEAESPEKAISSIKWKQIVEQVHSDNPALWRVAILDADSMLDSMLAEKGFVGDTLGERLNNAELGDFLTLNQAWEAHKIRNQIAHDGVDSFELTDRQARQVIDLYQQVFEEFDYL